MSVGPGMRHHRHRDVVERPGLQQQRFATAGLLGGGAQQRHPQAQVVGHLGQRQRGTHRRRGDDVVAAGMPDLGQRVILGADPDNQRSAAEVGAKGGVQTTGTRSDLETPFGDQRLRLGAAAMLGECQLRLGMDCVGQLDKIVATTPHQHPRRCPMRWLRPFSQYLTEAHRRRLHQPGDESRRLAGVGR